IELVTGNPTDVTLEIISMTADSGASASDFITNDGSAGRTLSGILSRPLGQGERVLVSNGIQTLEAVVNGINWTLVDPDAHSGSWNYRAWVENAVTGRNSERAQQTVTFDNSIVRATIDSIYDSGKNTDLEAGATTGDRTPTLSGKAEAGSLVTIYDGTTAIGSVHANDSGEWTWTPARALSQKTYQFNVVAEDKAGNQSTPSSEWAVNITFVGKSTENWDNSPQIIFKVGQMYYHENGLKTRTYVKAAGINGYQNVREDTGYRSLYISAGAYFEFWVPTTDAFSLSFYRGFGDGEGVVLVKYFDTQGKQFHIEMIDTADFGVDELMVTTFIPEDGRQIGRINVEPQGATKGIIVDSISWGDDVNFSDNTVSGEENSRDNEVDVNALMENKESDEENKGQIDLTGEENNQVTLNLNDLLTSGEKNLFIENGKTQLLITGDENDTVQLDDLLPDGTDTGDWIAQNGTVTVAGVEYQVFSHSGEEAEVLIQQGIKTELI
ncbi:Ig-like domain-containing protein, partial [Duffyella gerundensis]